MTTNCLLDGRGIAKYNLAIPVDSDHPDKRLFTHIGDGVIYSVSGRRYNGITRLSFFVNVKAVKFV